MESFGLNVTSVLLVACSLLFFLQQHAVRITVSKLRNFQARMRKPQELRFVIASCWRSSWDAFQEVALHSASVAEHLQCCAF